MHTPFCYFANAKAQYLFPLTVCISITAHNAALIEDWRILWACCVLTQAGGTVTTFLKRIRKPFGIIVPWEEVERRVICDALDKCGGNYLLAARLLGIGRTTLYRKATVYNYRTPKVQAEVLMTVSQSSLTA
jgi:hypothetical protein